MRSAHRFIPHALLLLVMAIALACGTAAAIAAPLPDGSNDFKSPGFVVRHAWLKFAYLSSPFRTNLSEDQKSARVARFFELNGLIDAKERDVASADTPDDRRASAEQELETLRAERAAIQNSVQVILEGRLARVVKEAGLTRRVGGDIVWPPPNIEFQHPPEVLVTSPRDRIEVQSKTLLQGDLTIEKIQQIEADAEADGHTSAAVIEIGGIAMYPAIIPETDDYAWTMSDIAHEWTHHYLFFAPLGRRYFQSAELTTINETLANMVGGELGAMLVREYPPPSPAPAPPEQPPAAPSQPAFNFNKTMHDLRLRVEALLQAGKIDEAEADMKQTRDFLEANGYYIREINQAYFAFQGSYADTPGSIDPIGPKLESLRHSSPSLRDFVHRAQEVTSGQQLDAELATKR